MPDLSAHSLQHHPKPHLSPSNLKITLLFAILNFACCLCFTTSVYGIDSLVSFGANWAYLDDGSDPGRSWSTQTFDDSSWNIGAAQLGYGDGDETTVVSFGSNSRSKHITTYFRHTFHLEPTDVYSRLILRLLRDDGAVVYINGIEVFRSNMPSGDITPTTLASVAIANAAERSVFKATVDGGVLRPGANVIAVEVHQVKPTSSDLSFDLELDGQRTGLLVPNGAAWSYLDDGSDQGSAWRELDFDDSSWSLGIAELGYGDGDEATVTDFGSDPRNKPITTYFRHRFTVLDPSTYSRLTLRLIRDDGAVVYLNGREIFRSNMPDGTINATTRAKVAIANAAETASFRTTVEAGLLRPGENVLAVEVHQVKPTSSDLSFDLRVEAEDRADDLVIRRGPYLQMSTPESVIVRWRTEVETESRVRFGSALGELDAVAEDSDPKTEHSVKLTGLTPETRYYYTIGTSTATLEGGDLETFFYTPPPVGESRPTRIWVIGDSGTGDDNARRVRDAYYNFAGSRYTDLWLMLGDNAYAVGTDNNFQKAVFNMYPELLRQTAPWPTFGNHDGDFADSATQTGPYYWIFDLPTAGEAGGVPSGTEAFYSFDYANIHFVVLDSHETDRGTDGAMWAWLEADLAQASSEWIIAFWHHPPYSKGSHDSDTDPQQTEMRENFLPLLESYGVDLVLSGHSHSYERSYLLDGHYDTSDTLMPAMILDDGDGSPDRDGAYVKETPGLAGHEGAVYVVAGCSSRLTAAPLDHPAMVLSLLRLGSLVLEVDGPRLDAIFLDDAGEVMDDFTLIKGAMNALP